MSKLTIFFILALTVYVNSKAPEIKKAANTDLQTQLGELIYRVEDIANNVSSSLQAVLPDTKQVTQTLIQQAHNFSNNIQSIVDKIQTQVINDNKGATDNLLKETSLKLTEIVGSFQEIFGKENTVKVNEITTQFNSGLKNAAVEIENLAKAVQPDLQSAGDTLQNFTKGLLDDFLQAVETVKNQISTIPK